MVPLPFRETKEIKIKRAVVFHATRWLMLAILGASALVLTQYMTGEKWEVLRFNVYALALMLWGWSTSVATFVCRLLGLSLAGISVERIEREDSVVPQVHPIWEPLVISRNKISVYIIPVCTTLLCVICFGPALLSLTLLSEDLERACVLIFMFSASLAVAIFSWANVRKPGVRIDSRGVAYCDAVGLSSRFIAWPRITSCEVVSRRNVFGEVVDRFLVLKNGKNKKLMTVRPDSRSKEENSADLDRVAERIKAELA